MARFSFMPFVLSLVFGLLSSCILFTFCAEDSSCSAEIQNFKKFSKRLISQTDLEKTSKINGASALSPFGIGYMLANINSKVWNVSNDGFDKLLNVPQTEISDQYACLVEKLKRANIHSSNTLYAEKCTNCSIDLPKKSQQLHTNLNYVDWKSNNLYSSWRLVNDMITNQLEGALNGSVVPKYHYFANIFYPAGVGAFINTNYFKKTWAQSWAEIGYKTFSDGVSVPFYQVQGIYPTFETENFTAVAIQFSDERKYAVFVYVNGTSTQNFFQDELSALLENGEIFMNPSLWPPVKIKRKIQVPRLNFTLYSRYRNEFENFGITNTFCPVEKGRYPSGSQYWTDKQRQEIISRWPFVAHPIVQTNYIHFSPDFLQLASATGMVIHSMQKLVDFTRPKDNFSVDNSDKHEEKKRSKHVTQEDFFSSNTILQYDMAAERLPAAEKDTICFDQPFFWYLHDSEFGPIQYGLVRSFADYKYNYDDRLNNPKYDWAFHSSISNLWKC